MDSEGIPNKRIVQENWKMPNDAKRLPNDSKRLPKIIEGIVDAL